MGALEQLLENWRVSPDSDLTVTLCSYLGVSRDVALIKEIGSQAEQQFGEEADVMLAVGRMYLGANLLSDARRALVAARRSGTRDARPLRYLGEVLLREGEAMRAQKVLARAVEMGGMPAAQAWLEHASRYIELEQRRGPRAVASEVEREIPREGARMPSIVELDPDSIEPLDDEPLTSAPEIAAPRVSPPPRTRTSRAPARRPISAEDEEEPTHILPALSLAEYVQKTSLDADELADDDLVEELSIDEELALEPDEDEHDADTVAMPLEAQQALRAAHASYEELTARGPHSGAATYDDVTVKRNVSRELVQAAAPSYPDVSADLEEVTDIVSVDQLPDPRQPFWPPKSSVPPPRPHPSAPRGAPFAPSQSPVPPPPPRKSSVPPPPRKIPTPPPPRPPALAPRESQHPRTPSDPIYAPPAAGPPPLLPAVEEEDSIIVAPEAALRPMRVPQITVDTGIAEDAELRRARARARVPTLRLADRRPGDISEAAPPITQLERQPGVVRARRPRSKALGLGRVLLFLLVIALGAAGVQRYVRHREQSEELTHVRDELDQVVNLLRRSNKESLARAGKELVRFEQQAALRQNVALLKMRHRILQLLVARENVSNVEQSVTAATAAGVPEKALAAGRVAAKLAKQDWAGALEAVEKFQARAAQDPYFQLTAGAALERVGDLMALERYATAWQLDPKFTIAAVLLARLALLEKGAVATRRQLGQIRAGLGPSPESSVLLGLLWAFDPERRQDFPKEAEVAVAARAGLAAPLEPVLDLTKAKRALIEGELETAREHIGSALAASESPFILAALGFMALEAHSETLVSDAAARLQQLDLDDATAAVLRARAALMSGQIEQAEAAIQNIKNAKKSASARVQAALIRAIAAYERLDAVGLREVLEELDASDAALVAWTALADAPRTLVGKELPPVGDVDQIRRSGAVWGDIIAVDLALAHGDAEKAAAIADQWIELDDRPLQLVRLARLRRYQQKYAEAAELCELAAMSSEKTAAIVIERTLALFSLDKPLQARRWVNANTEVSDGVRSWLLALITAQQSGRGLASLQVKKLALPDADAPLLLRLVVARTLALTRDARAEDFLAELAQSLPDNPDVRWALDVMKK